MNSPSNPRTNLPTQHTVISTLRAAGVATTLAVLMLAGCKSKQDAAIDQAKQQAAATGQPQQVVSTDKNGNVTTTTVQPPQPGQQGQAITTTVTPASAAAPVAANTPATAPGAETGPAPIAPGQVDSTGQPIAPPPGAAPVVRPADINVPAGTDLVIRINQHISVKTSRAGDRFDGSIADPVASDNNQIVIPRGTPVTGVVVESHRRGHFKGASILELRLTYLTLNGTRYRIDTGDLTRTKKGKGKRSAALIGGGAGAGMLIGGIATGGVGLLVGGLAGAGAGTAIGGLTGNRDIEIPAESLMHFKLAQNLTIQPA